MELSEQIEEFFRDPVEPPAAEGRVSTLHLLRREIQDCLIGRVVPEDRVLRRRSRRRLFATAMVIFAGIDLLAKFACSRRAGVRDGFVAFLRRFGRINSREIKMEEAEAIWRFRNGLMHSFGLHHEEADGRVVPLWIYHATQQGPVVSQCDDGWRLSIDDLFEMFIFSAWAYHDELKACKDLQDEFAVAFEKYGTLFHRGPHIAVRPQRH